MFAMTRLLLSTLAIIIPLLLAACATPTPKPDEGEIARAVLQEQAEAARAAAASSDTAPSSTANEPSPEPIALPAPIWNPTERGLQHIASGYICPREAAGFKRIGQDQFPGLQAGHDVACVYETPDRTRVRLHLTNFGRTVSPAAHLKGVETTIRDANPNAKIISTSPAARASDHALIFKVAPSPAINAPAHDQTANFFLIIGQPIGITQGWQVWRDTFDWFGHHVLMFDRDKWNVNSD